MRVLYFYLMKDAADRVRTVAPEHAAYWQGLRLPEYLGGPRRCGSGVRSSSTPWWWTAVRLRWKTTSSKIEPCWATRNLRIEFSTPHRVAGQARRVPPRHERPERPVFPRARREPLRGVLELSAE